MADDKNSLPEFFKAETKDSFGKLLGKTLLIVLGLALAALFVSWSFGWVAVERYSTDELYNKILSGRPEVKRMAAAEWSRELMRDRRTVGPTSEQSQALIAELLSQSQKSADRDTLFISGLATLLSYSQSSALVTSALKKSAELLEANKNSEALIYVVLALARLAPEVDPALSQLFVRTSQSADPSLRKASVMGLEKCTDAAAEQQLRSLLSDSAEDVRWNAIFALARRRDPVAQQSLAMLLQELLSSPKAELLNEELLNELFRAVWSLGNESLQAKLGEVANSHSLPRVRQLALQWFRKEPRH